MVENIWKLKNKILEYTEEKAKDLDRADVKELGELVDMVKDLADAEKNCWEAAYYRNVSEEMNRSSGYSGGMSTGGRQGYMQSARPGYTTSMGHDDLIHRITTEVNGMDRDEKKVMRDRILSMFE